LDVLYVMSASDIASMRYPTSIAVILLLLLPGCRPDIREHVDLSLFPQIKSFSTFGPNRASFVLEKSRELRITIDGGLTWKVSSITGIEDAFESATMLDADRGWAISRKGHVFATSTGGADWTKISELKDFTCANQIQMVSEKEGWIRECLSILWTRDGGVTWHETLSTVTPGVIGQPTGMFLFDANTLIFSGTGGQFYLTKDGGVTWKIDSSITGEHMDFNDVWFVDRMHGWLAGYQVVVAGESSRPLLLETTDGGESWREVSINTDIRLSSVCFVGDDGWVTGSRRIVNVGSIRLEGVLLHTPDGGKTWEQVPLGPEEPFLTDVRFVDKEHGWLVGRDSLFRTEDSGKTWNRVLSLPPLTHGAKHVSAYSWSERARRVSAYSLGWSEALRAKP
jgi:photosystem II stability/assembly factor-like uncharacterized protein